MTNMPVALEPGRNVRFDRAAMFVESSVFVTGNSAKTTTLTGTETQSHGGVVPIVEHVALMLEMS